MFLLQFHKAFWLFQFSFSLASANFSFKEIIGDLLTTFDFSMSFCNSNLACIAFSMLFFVAMFVEYFCVKKFLFLSESMIIICRWSSGDDVTSGFWDIPSFGGIPLGYAKVPSSRFLGFFISGLSNLKRGISFLFRGFCCLHCLMGLKLIPFSSFFFPVEW